MITFDQKNKIFYLEGKDYSYVIKVNEGGFLQNLYYGAKVNNDDSLFDYVSSFYNGIPVNNWNYDRTFDWLPSEIGSFGRNDFREPSIVVERNDGTMMSRFRFVDYEITEVLPKLDGMPHARYGGDVLRIKLKDDFSDTIIILNYVAYDNLNALVRNMEVINNEKMPIRLKKAFSFCVDLQDNDFEVLRLEGDWSNERNILKTDIGNGTIRIQSTRGKSSHQINPFMALLRKNCEEENGECYGVSLIYSGSFAITAEVGSSYGLRLSGGIQDQLFSWEIQPNGSFVTPQAVLVYGANGLGSMSRSFSDFYREHVIDKKWVNFERPIVINHWEATEFSYSSDNLLPIITEAAKLGIDTFVLDDGWFGKRDDDKSSLGDWFVNKKRIDLNKVIDCCKKNGMKFGIWFEPEMISEDSELYRNHPDYALMKQGTVPVRSRNQLVLDFTRKEVVDNIFCQMKKIISTYDISYIKWDMNRDLTEFFSSSLSSENQGEIAHRYTLGLYSLIESLLKEYPNIIFEGCASGGGRFDGGMLYYFPQNWTSDNTDAYSRTKIQYGTSVAYPLSSISCHVSAVPNGHTGREISLKTRGAVASMGSFGYELDLSKLNDKEKEAVKKQVLDYKKISSLIRNGDLYRLKSPFDGDIFSIMVVSKDKKQAYVIGVNSRDDRCGGFSMLKLNGLATEKKYCIEELNVCATGKSLVNCGVIMPKLREYDSWQWHIREIESKEY